MDAGISRLFRCLGFSFWEFSGFNAILGTPRFQSRFWDLSYFLMGYGGLEKKTFLFFNVVVLVLLFFGEVGNSTKQILLVWRV